MIWILALLMATHISPAADGVPNRQPQLAAGKGVVAIVFGRGHAVMMARSKDGGETFSEPAKIAEVPALALGRHRGPRVVFSGNAMVVSAIGGETGNGDLLAWRSTDGGKTWSSAARVNDSPGSAREGLHAMAADGDGHMAAVWLDLRSKGTHLYGAFSSDAGATWQKNVLLYESPDGTICQCCDPSLAALGKGEFAVMFRNAVDGNRDMYSLRVRDGSVIGKAEKLGSGSWKLNACPMDGGGIAVVDGRVRTAWRRGEDLFLADAGQAEVRVGSGIDIALAAGMGKTYAVWSKAGQIETWRDGKAEALGEAGAFPVVLALPDGGALVAWETDGRISARRIR